MNDTEITIARLRRRKRRRLAAGFLSGLVVAALLLIATAILLPPNIEFAAGEPKNATELNAWYPDFPPEQNAALRFIALVEGLGLDPDETSDDPSETFERAIEASPDAQAELHALLQLPGSRFPVDFLDGPDTGLSGERWYLWALIWNCSMAKQFAAAGDRESSFQHLADAWRMPSLLNGAPTFGAVIERSLGRSHAASATADVLFRVNFTELQVVELAALIRAERDSEALYRMLVGDRCLKLTYGLNAGPYSGPFNWTLGRQNDRMYLNYSSRLITASRLPVEEQLGSVLEVVGDIESAKTNRWSGALFEPALAPAEGNALMAKSYTRGAAYIDLILAAIAIERYKRVNGGAMPPSLDTLVSQFLEKVPIDPYTGNASKYRQLPDGYMLYLVGEDKEDNGGISSRVTGPHKPHDFAFIVSAERAKKVDAKIQAKESGELSPSRERPSE